MKRTFIFIAQIGFETVGVIFIDADQMHHTKLSFVAALRERVGILGGSYGGYATLAALAFTPEVFACGIDLVGPSNLETLLASFPPYWAPLLDTFRLRVGDPLVTRLADGQILSRLESIAPDDAP